MTTPLRNGIPMSNGGLGDGREGVDYKPPVDRFELARKFRAERLGAGQQADVQTAPRRDGRHRVLNSWEITKATERPGWQSLMDDSRVPAAWEKVLAAVEAVRASGEHVRRLDADQSADLARFDAAVEQALERGDSSVEVRPIDWQQERAARESVDRARQGLLTKARDAYDQVVQQVLPTWRGTVERELVSYEQAAREALLALTEPAIAAAERAAVVAELSAEPGNDPRAFLKPGGDWSDGISRQQAEAFLAARWESRHREMGRPAAVRAALAQLASALG